MPLAASRLTANSVDHSNIKVGGEEFIPPDWSVALDDTQVDIRNYVFESEKIEEVAVVNEVIESTKRVQKTAPVQLRPLNYRLNYTLEKMQTQVSKAFGSQFYTLRWKHQCNSGLGNAAEIRLSDLFEDKHIIAGFNIPANLRNSLFSLAYYNLEEGR